MQFQDKSGINSGKLNELMSLEVQNPLFEIIKIPGRVPCANLKNNSACNLPINKSKLTIDQLNDLFNKTYGITDLRITKYGAILPRLNMQHHRKQVVLERAQYYLMKEH